jgi:hypothetical protein
VDGVYSVDSVEGESVVDERSEHWGVSEGE